MADAAPEIHIDRSPDDVWAVVGDFGNLGHMPGVESVELRGDDRIVDTMGMKIIERLTNRSDDLRSITYSIVDGPVPVDGHEATVSVAADGDGSRVTWSVTVAPDDRLALFTPVYEGGLQALKQYLES